jgi:excisionase family DNA binding protein
MRNTLSTSTAAKLLGVAVGSISAWIDKGILPAGRTPGGHRRIRREDLVAFLRKQSLPVPAELQSARPKVLIVDDEHSVTSWLSDEIASAFDNVETLVAHDGYTAGELVTAEQPEVVLLDLYMPGLDGFEVCRRIKSRPRTRHTAVIAITAHPSDEARRRVTEAGADGFLSKPIDLEAVFGHLAGALNRAHPAGA